MDGYINREDIYKAIQKADRHSTCMTHNGLIEALKIIANLSDVNVKFIKRGTWVIKKDSKGYIYSECSKCGMINYAGEVNFCPNCGAEMNGEVQ